MAETFTDAQMGIGSPAPEPTSTPAAPENPKTFSDEEMGVKPEATWGSMAKQMALGVPEAAIDMTGTMLEQNPLTGPYVQAAKALWSGFSPETAPKTGADLLHKAIPEEYDPRSYPAQNMPEKLARGAGQGLIGVAMPGGIGPTLGKTAMNALVAGVSGATGAAAQEYAPEPLKPLAAIAGSVAGGAGTSLIPAAARKAANVVSPIVSPMAAQFRPATAERLGTERFMGRATNPDEVRAQLTGEGLDEGAASTVLPGSKPTTAQLTGDKGLLEQEIGLQRLPQYQPEFTGRREEQNIARREALGRIAPEGTPEAIPERLKQQLTDIDNVTQEAVNNATEAAQAQAQMLGGNATPEAYGASIRGAIETAENAARAHEKKLWRAVDPDGKLTLDVTPIRNSARATMRNMRESEKPMDGEEAAIFDVASKYRPIMPFDEMTALRSRVSTEMRNELSTAGRTPTYARLTALRGAIEDSIATTLKRQAERDPELATRLQQVFDDWNSARQNVGEAVGAGPAGGSAPVSGSPRGSVAPEGRFGNAPRGPSVQAPPVQPGYIRLYTADKFPGDTSAIPSRREQGWYTKDPDKAAQYGDVQYIDIPNAHKGWMNFDMAGGLKGAGDEYIAKDPSVGQKARSVEERANFTVEAAEKLRQATQATKERAQTFGEQPLKGITRKSGQSGPYKLPESAVPSRVFKPGEQGAQAVQAFRNAVGDEASVPTLRDYAASSLRRAAQRPDGTIDPKAFERWAASHADALRAMPEEVRGSFEDAAAATKAVEDVAAIRKDSIDRAQQGVLGRLLGLSDPADVVKTVGGIFGKADSVAKMRQLVTQVRGDPEAFQGLRKAVADHISRVVGSNLEVGTSGATGLKPDRLQNFVRDNRAVLAEVLKPEELGILDAIGTDMRRAARSLYAGKVAGRSDTAHDILAAEAAGHEKPSIWTSLIAAEAAHHVGGMLAGVAAGIGTRFASMLRDAGLNKIEAVTARMALDPAFARSMLMKYPTTAGAKANAERLLQGRLERAAAIGAVGFHESGPVFKGPPGGGPPGGGASGRAAGEAHPGVISTRFPTAKRATEDPYGHDLTINLEAMKRDPAIFAKNMDIVRTYPNLTTKEARGSPAVIAERFKNQVKDNLLWLHDQIPQEIRDRSRRWYDGARSIVESRAKITGKPDTSVAAIYAALSPQKDWYKNVSLGDRVMDIMGQRAGDTYTPAMAKKAPEIFGDPKFKPVLDAVVGKSLNDLTDPIERALWLRLYDQSHYNPSYDVISPEGQFLGPKRTLKGAPERITWGSLPEISKAMQAYDANGDLNTISRLMGEQHKVRNFYNNMLDPNNPRGDVTMDTHAVAAGLLRPLSANSLEVAHNLASSGPAGSINSASSSILGTKGLYGLYADAYREAAKERGLLPREMQSITWDAIRTMFPDTFKRPKNMAAIEDLWKEYRSGKLSLDEVRNKINEATGGVKSPDWYRPGEQQAGTARAAGQSRELDQAGVARPAAGAVDTGPRGGAAAAAAGTEPEAGPAGRLAGGTRSLDEAQTEATRAASGREPLAGLPTKPIVTPGGDHYVPGPIGQIHDVAEKYMRDAGMDYDPPKTYVQVDPKRAARIAQAFDEMPHAPDDPQVRAAYDAMIKETLAQYKAIRDSGLEIEFIKPGMEDPYAASPRLAAMDMSRNNHLWVFPTELGFGTGEEGAAAAARTNNPMLQPVGETIGGHQLLANDVFRIVHDYFGHFKDGNGFRAAGEENAWRSHSAMYSPLARRAMTSETRGQNSWVNYGPHGEANRTASAAETTYAPQKIGIMPEWVSEEGRADTRKFEQPKPKWTLNRQNINRDLDPKSPFQDAGEFKIDKTRSLGEQAQESVFENGHRTGVEHIVAIDKDGKVITNGYGTNNLVASNRALDEALSNPQESVVIHHNHPNGMSLSGGDIANLALPGAGSVWAHGQQGNSVFRASLTPKAKEIFSNANDQQAGVRRLFDIHSNIQRELFSVLDSSVNAIGYHTANHLLEHMTNVILDKAGVLDYHSNYGAIPHAVRDMVERAAERVSNNVRKEVFKNAKPDGGSARGVRYAGDVGSSFRDAEADATFHAKAANDIGGTKNDRTQESFKLPQDVRPAQEDLNEVLGANFNHGRVVGDKMVPIESLKGGTSSGEQARVQRLAGQISGKGGYIERPIVDHEGNVIEGQHRLDALRSLGAKEVPVTQIKDLEVGRNIQAMREAVRAAGLHSDQAHQMIGHALDALEEFGSAEKALQETTMPGKYQAAYEAALRAAEKGSKSDLPEGLSFRSGLSKDMRDDPSAARNAHEIQIVGPEGKAQYRGEVTHERMKHEGKDVWGVGYIENLTREHSGLGISLYREMARYVENHGGVLVGGMNTNRTSRALHEKLAAQGLAEPIKIGDRELVRIRSIPVQGRASGGRVMAHYVDQNPTEAQREAGNYRKAHIRVHGLDIAIENPKGSERCGVGRDGKRWSVTMPAHYGYIKGTVGKDKDHLDVYVGPHPLCRKVYVIDQVDADNKRWDEHKVMMGFASERQAELVYNRAFSDERGKDRIRNITPMDIEEFKEWLANGDTESPVHNQISRKAA